MEKCVVYTLAYNAEKTIVRAIESMLAQTEQNWVWYLVDNGSTDKTGEIISRYAADDSRILSLRNEKNYIYKKGNEWTDVVKNHNADDNLVWLDADDEYAPEFLEKMLDFMHCNNLDVAACGSSFVNAEDGTQRGVRSLKKDLIMDTPEEYDKYFPSYFQFMRTTWCKLVKLSVMRKFAEVITPEQRALRYGGDTVISTYSFLFASRVGILAQPLHRYYVSTQSSSYYLDENRIEVDRVLIEELQKYLMAKCGRVSPKNSNALAIIYRYALEDTQKVVFGASLSTDAKLACLQDMYVHPKARELFADNRMDKRDLEVRIRRPLLKWFTEQMETRKVKGARATGEVLAAVYPEWQCSADILQHLWMDLPEVIGYLLQGEYSQILGRLKIWFKRHEQDDPLLREVEIVCYHALGKPDDEVFRLYVDIRKKWPKSSQRLDIDARIEELLSRSPLLHNVGARLACVFPDVVAGVLKKDTGRALEDFLAASQNAEIADEDADAYYMLGQNLAAAAEQADVYIYFKKVWVSHLINGARNDEAAQELDELQQLLPGDEDFVALRKQLG